MTAARTMSANPALYAIDEIEKLLDKKDRIENFLDYEEPGSIELLFCCCCPLCCLGFFIKTNCCPSTSDQEKLALQSMIAVLKEGSQVSQNRLFSPPSVVQTFTNFLGNKAIVTHRQSLINLKISIESLHGIPSSNVNYENTRLIQSGPGQQTMR